MMSMCVCAEPDPPKPAKKRRVTKLDKEGNKPEVSVYAKAYNKVKAQFVRIRCSFVCLSDIGDIPASLHLSS